MQSLFKTTPRIIQMLSLCTDIIFPNDTERRAISLRHMSFFLVIVNSVIRCTCKQSVYYTCITHIYASFTHVVLESTSSVSFCAVLWEAYWCMVSVFIVSLLRFVSLAEALIQLSTGLDRKAHLEWITHYSLSAQVSTWPGEAERLPLQLGRIKQKPHDELWTVCLCEFRQNTHIKCRSLLLWRAFRMLTNQLRTYFAINIPCDMDKNGTIDLLTFNIKCRISSSSLPKYMYSAPILHYERRCIKQ